MPSQIIDIRKLLLNDIRIELSEEFDRNFERKAFFDRPWPKRKGKGRGSLLLASGKLRRSIRSKVNPDYSITWSTSEPYAAIHNDGGKIKVTAKMKKYAWYRYYQLVGKISYTKKGSPSKSKTNTGRMEEAQMWYAIALTKVGASITIPRRRFLGDHPRIRVVCNHVINEHLQDIANVIAKPLQHLSH